MTLHDTLTTRLADLKAERVAMDAYIEDLEKHLHMGFQWIQERAELMTEKFSHLFPQAYAEPVVDTSPSPQYMKSYVAALHEEAVKFKAAVAAEAGEAIGKVESLMGDPREALTFHALPVETVTYSDGTTATGVLPLPEKSPAQQDADDALDWMHG